MAKHSWIRWRPEVLGMVLCLAAGTAAAAPRAIHLQGGAVQDLEIRLTQDPVPSRPLGFRLVPKPGWTGGLAILNGGRLSGEPSASGWEWIVPPTAGERVLRLQVSATGCAALREPATLEVWAGGADMSVRRIEAVPLVFAVERSGACVAVRTAAVGATAIILLLPLYLWSMLARCRFIDGDALASKLQPLYEDDFGDWKIHRPGVWEVRGAIRRGLNRRSRFYEWLSAWPWKSFLPGQLYEETAQLQFNVRRGTVEVFPIGRGPGAGSPGNLYARATRSGLVFFASPSRREVDGVQKLEVSGLRPQPRLSNTLLLPPEAGSDEAVPRKGWEIIGGIRWNALP
jgi:hypothetical protein